jgi:protoheme ferro-lyase
MLLVRGHKGNSAAVARHLQWPEAKVRAAMNYARAFPAEIEQAISENDRVDFQTLQRLLPQASEVVTTKRKRS